MQDGAIIHINVHVSDKPKVGATKIDHSDTMTLNVRDGSQALDFFFPGMDSLMRFARAVLSAAEALEEEQRRLDSQVKGNRGSDGVSEPAMHAKLDWRHEPYYQDMGPDGNYLLVCNGCQSSVNVNPGMATQNASDADRIAHEDGCPVEERTTS